MYNTYVLFVDLPFPPLMMVWYVIFCCIVFVNLLRWTWMFICYEICVLMYFWKLTKRSKYVTFLFNSMFRGCSSICKVYMKNLVDSLTYTHANMRTCLILFLLFLRAVCMCYGMSASSVFCLMSVTFYCQHDIYMCQSGKCLI